MQVSARRGHRAGAVGQPHQRRVHLPHHAGLLRLPLLRRPPHAQVSPLSAPSQCLSPTGQSERIVSPWQYGGETRQRVALDLPAQWSARPRLHLHLRQRVVHADHR